jgi:hypothetical protein
MAAATIANKHEAVFGNYRVMFADVTIANNGDTWVTGMKKILAMSLDPTTNASVGATKSGGTITFASGGALTMSVFAIGYA